MRAAFALARECGRVVVFLEPIALYHERDLYEPGDGGWLFDYPAPNGAGTALLPGEVGTYGPDSAPLLLVTYGNGVRICLRAARRIEEETGQGVRVLDLRWLAPLPHGAVRAAAELAERVLVVDECRATQAGVADALLAHLAEGEPESGLAPWPRARWLGARCGQLRAPRAGGRRRAGLRGRRRRRRPAAPGPRRAGGPLVTRAVVVCPGRGSYTESSLGCLPAGHPLVQRAEELRAALGLEPLLAISTGRRASSPPATCVRRTSRP